MHALWNEVIGFLFLSFAVGFGFRTAISLRNLLRATEATSSSDFFKVLLTGSFTVMMAWFGISSFLRARKISRS